jgi:hypothetical protein
MRRIAIILGLALALTALVTSGCRGVDVSDPFHPTVANPLTLNQYGC